MDATRSERAPKDAAIVFNSTCFKIWSCWHRLWFGAKDSRIGIFLTYEPMLEIVRSTLYTNEMRSNSLGRHLRLGWLSNTSIVGRRNLQDHLSPRRFRLKTVCPWRCAHTKHCRFSVTF